MDLECYSYCSHDNIACGIFCLILLSICEVFPGSTGPHWEHYDHEPLISYLLKVQKINFMEAFHESWNQTHDWLRASAHVNTPQRNTTRRRTHTILRVTGVTEPGKLTGLLTQVGRRYSCHRQEVVGRQKQDDGMQEQDGREVRACAYSMCLPPEILGNTYDPYNIHKTRYWYLSLMTTVLMCLWLLLWGQDI